MCDQVIWQVDHNFFFFFFGSVRSIIFENSGQPNSVIHSPIWITQDCVLVSFVNKFNSSIWNLKWKTWVSPDDKILESLNRVNRVLTSPSHKLELERLKNLNLTQMIQLSWISSQGFSGWWKNGVKDWNKRPLEGYLEAVTCCWYRLFYRRHGHCDRSSSLWKLISERVRKVEKYVGEHMYIIVWNRKWSFCMLTHM